MKHSLFVATALSLTLGSMAKAADLPVKAPAPAAVPHGPYNWTGLYVGGNIGGSWGGHRTVATVDGAALVDATAHPDGVIGGGQIGYNWQTGSWVFGLEADIQGSGQKGGWTQNFTVLGVTGSSTTSDKLDYFGTVRGRVGYAWDRQLLYFTGGWAYGRETINNTTTVAGVSVTTTTRNDITDGWTVGGGWEWAFADRWSARIEYLYIDFGSDSAGSGSGATPGGTLTVTTNHLTDNVVRAGLNYKFW
jgi:outer membrane immunogenic protein